MNKIQSIIINKIKKNGPISLSEFMTLSLYHKDYGYYISGKPIGAKADFITSPEISQVFGELIGIWLCDVWQKMSHKKDNIIVELGPGNGTLISDALRAIKTISNGFEKNHTSVYCVEKSDYFIKKISKKITGCNIIDDVYKIPKKMSFIIANEFFDALPANQYIKINNSWKERLISINDTNQLIFCSSRNSTKYNSILPKDSSEGEIREIPNTSISIINYLSKHICNYGGLLLLIDYAKDDNDINGGLRAIKKHTFSDPLSEPGKQDLSIKVDFNILKDIAEKNGAKVFGPLDQSDFLQKLGIESRINKLIKHNPNYKNQLNSQKDRLINKIHMGKLFKVIAICSKNVIKPIGF